MVSEGSADVVSSRKACDWTQSRFGTRCSLALFGGLLPSFFVLFVLPIIPIYYGHVKPPGLMLSNMMSARASYQSLYIVGFGMPSMTIVFLLTDICRHFNRHGVSRPATNLFLLCVIIALAMGLQTLLAFNFDDGEDTWESWVHTWLHYIGTMTYFIFAACCSLLYTNFIRPEALEAGALHPIDSAWFRLVGDSMCVGTVIGGIVRIGHVTWPLTWCYPMLFVECVVIALGCSSAFVAHWRLLMHLDQVDPLLDLSFLRSKKVA